MSQELHYTSVPRGLKPGSRGFCTVAATAQISGPLVERLEAISGYQPVFPPNDAWTTLNPIAYSHLRVPVGGKVLSVVSRIGPAGLDYSGRPNKYAHHIVLEGNERPEGGPAWLLSQPGFVQAAWDGEPRDIPLGRIPPQGDRQPGVARAWQKLTGDAGWAGTLAEMFLADPRRPVFLVFRPGMDLLPLFEEALALLPSSRRWEVDFSTYFSQLPQGVTCAWRGVLEGSEEANNARRLPNALILDLCLPLGRAEGGALVHLARTGEHVAKPASAPTTPLESGRHIPQISRNPGAPTTDYSGNTSASRPRTSTGGYGLVPELARLAGGPNRSRRKRHWALIAVIVAACLVPFVAAGLFLARGPGLKASRDDPHGEKQKEENLEAIETNELNNAKKLDLAKHEDRMPRENNGPIAKPPDSKMAEPSPKKPTDNPAESIAGGHKGNAVENSEIAKGSPDTFVKPFFFPLDEPASALAPKNQKPLDLRESSFQITDMELLGRDQEFECKRSDVSAGALKWSVLPKKTGKSRLQDDKVVAELATFDASTKNEIKFLWKNTKPGDEREDERHRLRDCVLKITSANHVSRFCILQREPPAPQDVEQFKKRLKPRPSTDRTSYRYTWDTIGAFKGAIGKPEIAQCKLLKRGGEEVIPLEKQPDGSWSFPDTDGKPLFSVKLDIAAVLIDLHDKEPNSLKNRIANLKDEKTKLAKGKEGSTRTDDIEISKTIDHEIAELDAEQKRLDRLAELYDAYVDATITWEVSGIKLKIARLEFIKFDSNPFR